jgi:hypothetical protein
MAVITLDLDSSTLNACQRSIVSAVIRDDAHAIQHVRFNVMKKVQKVTSRYVFAEVLRTTKHCNGHIPVVLTTAYGRLITSGIPNKSSHQLPSGRRNGEGFVMVRQA